MEKFDEVPVAVDIEQVMNEWYWLDVTSYANDVLAAIKAHTGLKDTYLIDWKDHKRNLQQAIMDISARKVFTHSWGRVLTISKHSNAGMGGNLSEFSTALELMNYLVTEAFIGDISDKVDTILVGDWQRWCETRERRLRDAGWYTQDELRGDTWFTDKDVSVGDFEEAYEAWGNGFVKVTCNTCGGCGGHSGDPWGFCESCRGSGIGTVEV